MVVDPLSGAASGEGMCESVSDRRYGSPQDSESCKRSMPTFSQVRPVPSLHGLPSVPSILRGKPCHAGTSSDASDGCVAVEEDDDDDSIAGNPLRDAWSARAGLNGEAAFDPGIDYSTSEAGSALAVQSFVNGRMVPGGDHHLARHSPQGGSSLILVPRSGLDTGSHATDDHYLAFVLHPEQDGSHGYAFDTATGTTVRLDSKRLDAFHQASLLTRDLADVRITHAKPTGQLVSYSTPFLGSNPIRLLPGPVTSGEATQWLPWREINDAGTGGGNTSAELNEPVQENDELASNWSVTALWVLSALLLIIAAMFGGVLWVRGTGVADGQPLNNRGDGFTPAR